MPFLIPELKENRISAVIPVNKKTLGFSFKQKGFSEFNQLEARITYAQQLLNGLNVGVGIEYGAISTMENSTNDYLTSNISLLIAMHSKTKIITLFQSPFSNQLKNQALLATTPAFKVGVHYAQSSSISLIGEIHKQLNFQTLIQLSTQWQVNDYLSFYLGVQSNYTVTASIAFLIQKFSVSISYKHQQPIGDTPSILSTYRFD